MLPFFSDYYGNAGAIYKYGRMAKDKVEEARERVAHFIGAKPDQIIFTSGGTESNNIVMSNLGKILSRKKKSHVIIGATEHDSVLRPVKEMCARLGFDITFITPNKYGVIESSSVLNAIQLDTGFVSVMMVNNETGAENPVDEIGMICSAKDIVFHTDCVQAAGDKKIDVEKILCDFLSLSSHKIYGPKGVGALFVRDRASISPLIIGGTSQEYGIRGGTENVPGIVGFGKACEVADERLCEVPDTTSMLKQTFFHELLTGLGDMSNIVHVNGQSVMHPGKILNLRIDGVDAETLVLFLDAKDICISAGSACRSHESEPSHVLTAMGLSDSQARQSVRISFSKTNKRDEVISAANEMAECCRVLRRQLP